ncbi:MAG: rRNA maturation RNase YbeY [Lachnospiraceae bacterium]|nr:rRNA maturation RNase YbeY [Lachnospiraceae bacterium]
MSLIIEKETDFELTRLDGCNYEELLESVVNAALDYAECPYEVELNILLTDNENIHKLNKEFRDVDSATDVLSFPMLEYEKPADFDWLEEADECFNPESGELMLGDIVISLEKVKEQAEKYGHSEKRELAFLTAHSMLHLFGYDHMTPEEASVMEAKQEEIMDILGIKR